MLLIVGVVALVVYTISVGLGLLGGAVPFYRTYLLVALPCVLPLLWNVAGFLLYDSNDYGLLLAGAGWGCAASGLFLQYMAVTAAMAQDPNALTSGVPVGGATMILVVLALVLIMGGALLSSRRLSSGTRR